jgi:hypothetical protein
MKLTRRFITLAFGVAAFASPAMAQQTIKIGELSSYKAFPAFTDRTGRAGKWPSTR